MQNDIWLYKSHENFQVGKSYLEKGSVFHTNRNIFLTMVILLLIWGFFWWIGEPLRQQIQFWQTGRETIGTVSNCRQVHGMSSRYGSGTHILVSYYYLVSSGSEPMYYDAEDKVYSCDEYSIGSSHPVFYLVDNPPISSLNDFADMSDWIVFFLSISVTSVPFIWILYWEFLDKRQDNHRYERLKQADILLKAKITEYGGNHAAYKFLNPTGKYLEGRIRSEHQYKWPKNIAVGDTLHILYVDDETYCVL
jgi:hypothetical protein